MKIIPAIDIMGGKVVRLVRGNPDDATVYGSDPVAAAVQWEKEGADMLHVVDLDATLGRGSNLNLVKKIAESVGVPVQAAGGLRDEKAVASALSSADRAVVGTMAFKDRPALERVLGRYGPTRIVASVDHRDGIIAVNGWQSSTGVRLMEGIRELVDAGVEDFLLTNVSRDGTLGGPDTEGLSRACSVGGIRVIASGGISGPGDIAPVRDCGAWGAILGKAMYEGRISIREAKQNC